MCSPSAKAPPRRVPKRPTPALFGLLTLACLSGLALSPTRAARAQDGSPEGLTAPKLLQSAPFFYPAGLTRLRNPPRGTVILKYVVGTDGIPKEIEFTQRVQPEVDAAARAAVAKLRYQPAVYQGQRVEVVLSASIDVDPPTGEEAKAYARQALVLEPPVGGVLQNQKAQTGQTPSAAPNKAEGSIKTAVMPVRIRGQVLEAGMRSPIAGAEIIAMPAPDDLPIGKLKRQRYDSDIEPAWSVSAETDEEGKFSLRGIPDGRVRIAVITSGFDRIDYVLRLGPREQVEVKYYQEPSLDYPYRTVVRSEREGPVEVSRRTVSAEELTKIPGTQGDALKAIQNFPGVARAPFGAGLLVIRGAAPGDSRTFFAQHEIPQLFHFGGLSSVVNSDVLREIDFLPGNFDSRFGDAIGGIVNVAPRRGRRDGFHGYIDSDLIDTGALLEGPIGKGSFVLSARRSYIDLVLGAVVPDDAGVNLTLAPRYWDYQTFFDYPIAGGDFTARIFGSDDQSKILFAQADDDSSAAARNSLETQQTFHRFDLSYKKRFSVWSLMIAPTFRYEHSNFNFGGRFRFNLDRRSANLRTELTRSLGKKVDLRLGHEMDAGHLDIRVEAALPPREGSQGDGEPRVTSEKGTFFNQGLYATVGLKLGKGWTLFPGARLSLYSGAVNALSADPRFRTLWKINEKARLKAGVGLFSQSANPQRTNEEFGNPRLRLEKGVHSSLSYEHRFFEDLTAELTLFHKALWDLSADSSQLATRDGNRVRPELYASTGIGRIYGLEFLFRKQLTRNFFGWVSYTLMRSERKRSPDDPFVLFDQDQTHILTTIASYKFPRRWQIGARFRLVSGNPSTPITDGIFDATTGSHIGVPGPDNSSRLTAFHQMDLRVDKTWIYKRFRITGYLDVQNIYNAQNTEALIYSFNFRQNAPITSLPIFPSLGLKLEF